MIDLGTLQLGIQVDNKNANKELDNSTDKVSKLSKAGDVAKSSITAFGKGMAIAATSVVAAGAAVFGFTTKTAEAQDRVDKMSQSLGLSNEKFQEWDYIMAQNGASIDSMKVGMKTLMSDTTSTQEAFSELGLNVTDSMSKEEVFEASVKALQGVEDNTKKAKLATELFGKAGTDLMPMLNQTTQGTEELRQRAHDLGLVMSDEAVANGVAFGDTLDDLKKSAMGAANGMLSQFTPALNEGMNALIGIMQGSDGAEEAFTKALNELIEGIVKMLPTLVEKGMEIIMMLAKGILAAIPTLINNIITIIPTIVQQLLSLLPMIVDAGIQILLSLVNGIAQMLPALIPQIIQLIITIVSSLLDNIGLIIDAGIQLIFGLMDGLIASIPQLIEAIPTIIDKLIMAITDNLPKLIEAGLKLTWELTKGIIKAIPDLLKAIPQIIGSIVKGFINYYSKIFNIGIDLVKKIWEGIKSVGGWIAEKFSGLFSGIFNGLLDIVKAPLNAILSFINILLDGVNLLIKGINKVKIKVPDWVPAIGGKDFGFNIPEVPKFKMFADGGILTKPTTFGFMGNTQLVGGEAGTEAVIPLKELPSLMARMGLIPKPSAVNTTIAIDGREFAVATSPYISEELAFA